MLEPLDPKAYVQQQAHRTFKAMDADGNGYIEQKEFCMVVEAGFASSRNVFRVGVAWPTLCQRFVIGSVFCT